jgi:hypothetical protein
MLFFHKQIAQSRIAAGRPETFHLHDLDRGNLAKKDRRKIPDLRFPCRFLQSRKLCITLSCTLYESTREMQLLSSPHPLSFSLFLSLSSLHFLPSNNTSGVRRKGLVSSRHYRRYRRIDSSRNYPRLRVPALSRSRRAITDGGTVFVRFFPALVNREE